jgi:hypothetical protein
VNTGHLVPSFSSTEDRLAAKRPEDAEALFDEHPAAPQPMTVDASATTMLFMSAGPTKAIA